MQFNVLTIVGVGLIGGSIGLAAKRRGLAKTVRGVGRQQASLERARDVGAIDETCLDLEAAAAGSDLLIFCTPVDRIAEQVLAAAPRCAAGTLMTDAGSTKATIVRTVDERLPGQVRFVGSHPLAGSEKRGPDFADGSLFTSRWTILTPTDRTDPAALERVRAFWQALGSHVRVMSPEDHDRALAVTSHLPHLAAAALAGILPPELYELTATGFRDTTRVAAGDPELWSAIFAHNRPALLEALTALEDRLGQFRQALEQRDAGTTHELLARAKKVRDALGS